MALGTNGLNQQQKMFALKEIRKSLTHNTEIFCFDNDLFSNLIQFQF